MKKTFYKIMDEVVPTFYCEEQDAWEYIKNSLDGRNADDPIKVSKVEMTQKQFDALPEFEG
jgi:hypothetical protein